MILPLWFVLIWAAASLASVGVAALILTRRMLGHWPSLFAVCAGQALAFWVLYTHRYPHSPYPVYFRLTWSYIGINGLLQIWLAWDVFRSIPSSRFIPMQLRRRVMLIALIVGAASCWIVRPDPAPLRYVALIIDLNRCVTFAWGAILLCCLAGTVVSGFGFTLTGMRVLTGAIMQLMADLVAAMVYASSLSTHAKAVTNALDTSVGLVVSLYWAYAVLHAQTAKAELEDAFQNLPLDPLQPSEKKGQV